MINCRLFGKNFFTYYKHNIMRLETGKLNIDNTLSYEKITLENVEICKNFKSPLLNFYLQSKNRYANGYLFHNENNIPVGYLWVMKKGGDEVQYKIRNIDAFLFDVYVFPEFRGKGYCGQMISCVCCKLGLGEVYLACRPENKSAMRSYTKMGFKTVAVKRFLRILRINIPYHIL